MLAGRTGMVAWCAEEEEEEDSMEEEGSAEDSKEEKGGEGGGQSMVEGRDAAWGDGSRLSRRG